MLQVYELPDNVNLTVYRKAKRETLKQLGVTLTDAERQQMRECQTQRQIDAMCRGLLDRFYKTHYNVD